MNIQPNGLCERTNRKFEKKYIEKYKRGNNRNNHKIRIILPLHAYRNYPKFNYSNSKLPFFHSSNLKHLTSRQTIHHEISSKVSNV